MPHHLAHYRHVSQHLQTIAHDPNLGVRGIRPMHRHLLHAKTQSLCQQQYLDIEGKAVGSLSLKNSPRGSLPKSLEATLRIPNLDSSQPAHKRRKSRTHALAHPTLLWHNLAVGMLAITHDELQTTLGFKNRQSAINLVQRSA